MARHAAAPRSDPVILVLDHRNDSFRSIWIMADDLGVGEPSCWPADSPHGRIPTSNICKLASEGIRFTDSYAGEAVCAPSRGT